MNKKLLFALFIFILTALFVIVFFLLKNRTDNNDITNIDNNSDNGYGLSLEKEYKSDNIWSYIVTGQFPNSCYTAAVDEIVRESYPEQVTILVSVSVPSKDMMCAQVITDFVHEGTFSASTQAVVKLELKNE